VTTLPLGSVNTTSDVGATTAFGNAIVDTPAGPLTIRWPGSSTDTEVPAMTVPGEPGERVEVAMVMAPGLLGSAMRGWEAIVVMVVGPAGGLRD
jgi:hypothetical protein